jgi:hypothetical protein
LRAFARRPLRAFARREQPLGVVHGTRARDVAIQGRGRACSASPWIASAKRPRNDDFTIRNVLIKNDIESIISSILHENSSQPAMI